MNILKYFIITIIFITFSTAKIQDVTLQLQWKHQFQFAGYYMAKEKGFYKDVNLNVDLLEHKINNNTLEKVLSQEINYAIGRTSLINNRSHGKKVVLLASILQSSPLALATKKSSNIKTLSDFKNKRMSITNTEAETSIFPLLLSHNITKNDLKINYSFNKVNDFINDKTDIITLYTSNQEYSLKKQGFQYNIFHPKDYDFNFYDDILYTSEQETIQYKQRTLDFKKASLKGWNYAFNNIEETINVILKKYNTQNKSRDELLYEANVLKKHAYSQGITKLGNIEKTKIQRIYDIYHIMGLTHEKINLDTFILENNSQVIKLTKEETAFLRERNYTISAQNERNWPPYNFNNKNTPKGYSIDYFNLLASKLNIKINYIEGDNWSSLLEKFKHNEIDVMLNTVKNKPRLKEMDFTTQYIASTKAILTNNNTIYTLEDLNNKTVAVIKDSYIHNYLKANYPLIHLNLTYSVYESLISVINNNVDATISNFAVANHLLQENALSIQHIRVTKNPALRSTLHFATMKNNHLLNSILQKLMNAVTEEENNKLKHKWFNKPLTNKKISSIYLQQEEEYLKTHKVIKMCNNPTWEPIEFAEHGNMNRMKGIAIDTIRKIEKNLNIRFQTIHTDSWTQSQEYFKNKKCDILPAAITTDKRKEYAIFTEPYLKLPLAIFTSKNKPLVNGLSDVMDKTWSRQQGSGLIHYMNKHYPNNKLILTNTTNEAFQFVNNGTSYFTIATLPVASNLIHKYQLDNLQIAGYSNILFKLSIAVQKDKVILRNILDKALKEISQKEHREILKSWVNNENDSYLDSKTIRNIIILLVFFAVLLFYRQYLLNKANSNLKNLVDIKTKELKDLNSNLEVRIEKAILQNREKDKILHAQAKMVSMGEMIGNIAHQWRQPLSVISTGVTGMQVQKEYGLLDDEQFNKTCKIINENSQYLSKTIDDFKNFIQGNRIKEKFNLKASIETFIHLVEGTIKKNNIKCIIDIEESLTINAYENELTQCFINIFNNAKDAFKETHTSYKLILISASIIEDKIIIKIQDNAEGINEDIIHKVFEPYFTTKHKSQGTGLGLNMTYKLIVDGMHGQITASNQKFTYKGISHFGAEFKIILPLN